MMDLKKRIIHESLKLFSLHGFSNTSMNQILKAAGVSKGGFYNHFQSKEELFFAVLSEARKFWRETNLAGLDEIERPVEKIKKLLENYRSRYLKDEKNLPGGCVFITLAVELADEKPHLAQELNEGFIRFKGMIHRLLEQGKSAGELKEWVDTESVTEVVFSGMLGASVVYNVEKSSEGLNRSIDALMKYLDELS